MATTKTAARRVPAARKTLRSSATSAQRPAPTASRPSPTGLLLLVATRKGAWLLRSDRTRRSWTVDGPHFLGHIIQHMVLDPRDGRTLLAAAKTGHLGPTVFRSTDFGKRWKEAQQPPAFAKRADGSGRVVDHTFWLTPGHASEPGVWYAGTSPQGLFRSDDGGVSWRGASPINEDPQYIQWMGTVQDGTPDGPKLHSIIVDPRDPQHLYFGMSGGGVHESHDGGQTFRTLIDGLEVVEGFPDNDPTFHDPHCIRICPSNPDRLYQQNHCGIYRLDRAPGAAAQAHAGASPGEASAASGRSHRPSNSWVRIGRAMPKRVGDVGFNMVVHPRDADTCWVLPMDGQTVWPRTSIAGKPAVYVTRNAGKTWQRQDSGMPASQAWWTVKRQAMCGDARDPVGLYFGTSNGEVWMSRDEGAKWQCIARHLPEIYAVEVAELG
jgi:photosystem II stability/assembly factor-like uncharacterized protein